LKEEERYTPLFWMGRGFRKVHFLEFQLVERERERKHRMEVQEVLFDELVEDGSSWEMETTALP